MRTSVEPDRAGEPVERRVERVVERAGGADAVLAVEGPDDEAPLLPLRLEVGAADDPVAAQEREHVVAVLPLRRRLVDLDQVVEAEDPPRERAVPEQVVERREQHGGARGGPVELGVGRDEDVGASVVDAEPPEAALGDELRDRRPDAGRAAPQAPVLRDPASVSAPRARTACSANVRSTSSAGGTGASSCAARDHALGQVVDALEALASRDHELAVVPEPLEHRLRRLPVPHAAAGRPLELPGRERAVLADPSEDLVARGADSRLDVVDVAVPVAAAVLHRTAEERPRLDREQARLVRPVLEDPAVAEQLRDGFPRVVADAARERDPVAALDRRDRVELDARQPADRRLDARSRSRAGTGPHSPAPRPQGGGPPSR